MSGVRGRSSESEYWSTEHDGVIAVGDSLNETRLICEEVKCPRGNPKSFFGKEKEKRHSSSFANNDSDEDVLRRRKIKNAKKRTDKRRKIKERKYLEISKNETNQRGETKNLVEEDPRTRISTGGK